MTVLHVAPHPDDETLGAPATLRALREGGERVVNLLVSLGRPADHARRRAEAREAARRLDGELIVHEPPLAISTRDDRATAQATLTATLRELLDRERIR